MEEQMMKEAQKQKKVVEEAVAEGRRGSRAEGRRRSRGEGGRSSRVGR